jgi:hypothetical protein
MSRSKSDTEKLRESLEAFFETSDPEVMKQKLQELDELVEAVKAEVSARTNRRSFYERY